MTSINGVISMAQSPGYGLRGDAPAGDYTPPASLGTITFAGVADGAEVPAPLIVRNGTFEIRDEELRATGSQPPLEGGYAWIISAETGSNEGVISAIYNANGGFGDESGIMVRSVDPSNFWDIINLNGTIALVEVTANTPGVTGGSYAIPGYSNVADYLVTVACWNDYIFVYVDNVLVITYQTSVHLAGTLFGFKFGGTTLGVDDIVLPHAYADPRAFSRLYVSGHSMFTHDGAGSDRYTRTANWIGLISDENALTFEAGGEFGHVPDIVTSWNSNGAPTAAAVGFGIVGDEDLYTPWIEGETFAAQDFTEVTIMPSNFEQSGTFTAQASDAADFIDVVRAEEPAPFFLVHMSVPETSMVGAATTPFVDNTDLTESEFATFKTWTRNEYLAWHQGYCRAIVEARPNAKLRLIPTGLIIFDLLDNRAYMSAVSFTDLFMDDAPHGTQTFYFLQAIIYYRVLYGTIPDLAAFTFPAGATQVIDAVRDNLVDIALYVEQRLEFYHGEFMTENGIGVY